MHKIKIHQLITICLALCMMLGAVHVNAAENKHEVVKVGYVLQDGYQEGGEGEIKNGWGYDYLIRIANDANWEYEYVYGTFSELLQKLENGEIDLMGNLSYTPERAQKILYSDEEQGVETFDLYVKKDNTVINAEDVSTLNGKKIGVNKDTYYEIQFGEWCRSNNITCEIVEYNELDKLYEAFENDKVDAIVESNVFYQADKENNWKKIINIGKESFYFGVNKNRPDLLNKLNEVQGKILKEDPYYNERLISSYVQGKLIGGGSIGEDTIAWLEKRENVIRFGYRYDFSPYSRLTNDGEVKGLIQDFMEQLNLQYPELNLQFEVKGYKNYSEMVSALKNGEVDALFPVYGSYWTANQQGYCQTIPFSATEMILVHEDAFDIEKGTIGYLKGNPYIPELKKRLQLSNNLVKYDSDTDALKALKKGEIDAYIISDNAYEKVSSNDKTYKKLHATEISLEVPVSIAVATENRDIIPLFNSCISNWDSDSFFGSVVENADVDKKVTLGKYISDNPLAAIVFIGILIALAAAYLGVKKSLDNKKRLLQQVEYVASHDNLTDLYNREGMQKEIKKQKILGKPAAVIMMDVDDFKQVNDKYGHLKGDHVLIATADILRSIFGEEAIISRLGGDEFMCIVPNVDLMEKKFVIEKVERIYKEIQFTADGYPKIGYSIGVFFSNARDFDKLYTTADQALYMAKEQGKNRYVIM